jgi:DNA/RNA-binding domain of Phe-tRNA-synthetase-like protein
MRLLPFRVSMNLDGWSLFWSRLEVDSNQPVALAELRERVAERARRRFGATSEIGSHPPAAALRSLFRAAGCDPTRYRPASEALLRRLVKGNPLPEIHPLVDVNNCLSAELAVPCCVMVEGSFGHQMVWRSGRAGESYESLRGPFNLENKPVLVDQEGPLDAPITGNVRVAVQPDTKVAWLVAYMPAAAVDLATATECLRGLLPGTGIEAEHFEQR